LYLEAKQNLFEVFMAENRENDLIKFFYFIVIEMLDCVDIPQVFLLSCFSLVKQEVAKIPNNIS
jgi:2-polyprenyl-3-methyl-5-hydroxy-6-metoxy-1,4-benzoquinol methylase